MWDLAAYGYIGYWFPANRNLGGFQTGYLILKVYLFYTLDEFCYGVISDSTKLRMREEKIFTTLLEWPRWKFSFKLGIISFLLASTAFLVPNLEQKYRNIAYISLFIILILINTFSWIKKIIVIIFKRTKYFRSLFIDYEDASSKLGEFEELFFNYLIKIEKKIEDRRHEIEKAKIHKDDLYIVLKKNSKLNLVIGNKIVVYDKKDLVFLGQFEITEVRNSEYYAIGIKNIDPVLFGFTRQKGETSIMPNIVAIYLP